MGNQISGMYGISPLTLEKYLYSVNNNLLIPLLAVPDEDDNFMERLDENCLYHHLPA
jgi:hypothetical protein